MERINEIVALSLKSDMKVSAPNPFGGCQVYLLFFYATWNKHWLYSLIADPWIELV